MKKIGLILTVLFAFVLSAFCADYSTTEYEYVIKTVCRDDTLDGTAKDTFYLTTDLYCATGAVLFAFLDTIADNPANASFQWQVSAGGGIWLNSKVSFVDSIVDEMVLKTDSVSLAPNATTGLTLVGQAPNIRLIAGGVYSNQKQRLNLWMLIKRNKKLRD